MDLVSTRASHPRCLAGVPARSAEAQRPALARLLALRPALLVASEPSSRLDPPVQAEAFRLLRNLAIQDGLFVLLITHGKKAATVVADPMMALPRMVAIAAER